MRRSVLSRAVLAPVALIIMAVAVLACRASGAEAPTVPKQDVSTSLPAELTTPASTAQAVQEGVVAATRTPLPTPTPKREPQGKTSGRQGGTIAGAHAPPLVLPDLNGEEINLTDLRGRPVLLNFWTTW